MTVALDTNILAYAQGVNGLEKKEATLAILDQLSAETVWVPTQALGELFNVLVRKAGFSRDQARAAILSWRDAFPIIPTTEFVMLRAADLAADHQFAIWDAVMLSAAIEAGCRLLLSEDMHDGFTSIGTTIANPFAAMQHPHLVALMRRSGR